MIPLDHWGPPYHALLRGEEEEQGELQALTTGFVRDYTPHRNSDARSSIIIYFSLDKMKTPW